MKFFRTSKALAFLLITTLLYNCTAQFPASSIFAKDEMSDSLVKWPEITDDSPTHQVRVRPLENIDEMLLFEVEVKNKTNEPIFINPDSWQMNYGKFYSQDGNQIADTFSNPLSGAEVNQGYQKVADKIDDARTGTTVLIVLGIVIVIVALVALSNKHSNNSSDNYSSYDTYTNVGINISFGFHNRSFEPPNTEEWNEKQKSKYFRQRGEELQHVNNGPQTIPPGETYIYGIFFPRKEAARSLILNGSVNNEDYTWEFQHDGLNQPKVKM